MRLSDLPKNKEKLADLLQDKAKTVSNDKKTALFEVVKQSGILVTLEIQSEDHISMDSSDNPYDEDEEAEDHEDWSMEDECFEQAQAEANAAWEDPEISVKMAENLSDEEYEVLHMNFGDDGPFISEGGRGGVASYGWDFHRLEFYCVLPSSIVKVMDVMAA